MVKLETKTFSSGPPFLIWVVLIQPLYFIFATFVLLRHCDDALWGYEKNVSIPSFPDLFSYNCRFSYPVPPSTSYRPWPLPLCLPLLTLLYPLLFTPPLLAPIWWPSSFAHGQFINGEGLDSQVICLYISAPPSLHCSFNCDSSLALQHLYDTFLPLFIFFCIVEEHHCSTWWQTCHICALSSSLPESDTIINFLYAVITYQAAANVHGSHLCCVQETWIMSRHKIPFIDI